MEEKKIEKYYQNQGKQIVDSLFDSKVFRDGLTRDDMSSVEDLIAFYFQSNADTVKKATEILTRLKK